MADFAVPNGFFSNDRMMGSSVLHGISGRVARSLFKPWMERYSYAFGEAFIAIFRGAVPGELWLPNCSSASRER